MVNRSFAVFIPTCDAGDTADFDGEFGGCRVRAGSTPAGSSGKPQDNKAVKLIHVAVRRSWRSAGGRGPSPTLAPCRHRVHQLIRPPAPTSSGARIGLFGGTFDPPHVGHLVTAVNVRHALDLDTVILMVANVPWQKQGERPITPAADRLAMVEAAVADVPGLAAGRLEIDAGGPSYTADTLAALARLHPDAELFTIVGDDAAAGLHIWERFEEVVAQSTLVVVDRPGEPVALPDDVPGSTSRCPAWRCRAPTCAPDSPTAARSTTCSPIRCST